MARSEYLPNLSRDFSRELGDLAHGRSNSTQIHNLWRESGLSEKEFAGLLYQSRDLTRRYAVLRPCVIHRDRFKKGNKRITPKIIGVMVRN
jgi:hypothetical protein